MKKALFTFAAVLALGGSLAVADIMLPSQVAIGGDDAKAVNAKIAEITGETAKEFMGRKILSANAQVSCSEFGSGQISCKINILK
jgi:hypothetical protein